MIDWPNINVTVTGGAGFLGSAVCERLRARGCRQISVPRRAKYDLTTIDGVRRMYDDFSPDLVIHLAAEVGGIGANRKHPGRFFYANMSMGLHLIEEARLRGLEKFVFAGTMCAYPKFAPVPFREESIWDGYPEETNAPYGVAKKSLFVMLDSYQREYGLKSAVAVPVNLYGPGDHFDPQSSHVIPALIRKCAEAVDRRQAKITCWGTGAAHAVLYVADAAEGVVRVAEVMEEPTPINLGTGQEISIRDLIQTIARLTGFTGEIEWDSAQPDGQPRRCIDVTRARELLDWKATTGFEDGLLQTIRWYRSQVLRQAG